MSRWVFNSEVRNIIINFPCLDFHDIRQLFYKIFNVNTKHVGTVCIVFSKNVSQFLLKFYLIYVLGNEAHANSLTFSLLDNKPWTQEQSQQETSKINFLQEAKQDQAATEDVDIESDNDDNVIEDNKDRRKKKKSINVYEFFQNMQQIGVRPLEKK